MRPNQVLLVDDEPWSLHALKNSFDWEASHFEVTAQTNNPFEALELLKTKKFDAAFIDIRMPGITGLELIHTAKTFRVQTEYIITSGYSDFSYVQEALRHGVFDYLLKPIIKDASEPLLERLSTHLEKKHRRRDEILYENLLKSSLSPAELLFGSEDLMEHYSHWQVIEIKGDISQFPRECLPDPCNRWELNFGTNKTIHIINSNIPMKPTIGTHLPLNVGISSSITEVAAVPKLLREAHIALNSKFVNIDENMLYYQVPNYSAVLEILDQLVIALECKHDALLISIFNKIPQQFLSQALGIDEVLFFISQIKSYLLRNEAEEALMHISTFDEFEELLYNFTDLSALCSHLCELLMSNIPVANEEKLSIINEGFMKLLNDVNQNFHTRLQLSELAKRYHLNFTYCCDLFKKTTGATFIQYVTDLRFQKAEKLLIQTDLSIDAIAEKVGFSDTHYFSNVFKKHYHVTPLQFRKQTEK